MGERSRYIGKGARYTWECGWSGTRYVRERGGGDTYVREHGWRGPGTYMYGNMGRGDQIFMGTWVEGTKCVGEVEGRDQVYMVNWGRGPSVCEAQRRGRDQVCVRLKGEGGTRCV